MRIDHVIVAAGDLAEISARLERLDGGREQKVNDGDARFLEGAGGWL